MWTKLYLSSQSNKDNQSVWEASWLRLDPNPCDQMARLCVQYFAGFSKENLPICFSLRSNFFPKLCKSSRNSQRLLQFCPSGEMLPNLVTLTTTGTAPINCKVVFARLGCTQLYLRFALNPSQGVKDPLRKHKIWCTIKVWFWCHKWPNPKKPRFHQNALVGIV